MFSQSTHCLFVIFVSAPSVDDRDEDDEDADDETEEKKDVVMFRLLTKKNNKPVTKDLAIPVECELSGEIS